MAIFCFALLSRLLFLFLLPSDFILSPVFFSDSTDYIQIAQNILHGKGFALSDQALAVRPPLYPLFLAILYGMGFSLSGILVIQCLLGAMNSLLVYFLARSVLQEKPQAYLAAVLYSLDPFHVAFCSFILTEILFTSLLLFSMLLVLTLFKQKSKIFLAFLSGAFLGIATLCRPSLLSFICFLSIFLAWQKRWNQILLLFIGFFLALFPWTIRNWLCFHRLVPVTATLGLHLYEVLGPQATGGPISSQLRYPKEAEKLPEAEKDIFLRKWVWKYVWKHPKHVFKLAIKKAKRFWNVGFNESTLNHHLINWLVISFMTMIYISMLAGIFLVRKASNWWIVLTPVLYFGILHLIFMGSVRYRIPIMPYIEILAASGIIFFIHCLSSKIKFLF